MTPGASRTGSQTGCKVPFANHPLYYASQRDLVLCFKHGTGRPGFFTPFFRAAFVLKYTGYPPLLQAGCKAMFLGFE